MGEKLAEYESWLKDIAFFKRIRNVRVLNPNIHLIMEESIKSASKRIVQYWDQDPVHMTASGYKVVAAAVIEMLDEMDKSYSTDSVAGAAGGSRTERTWGDDAAALHAPERNRGARGSWRGNKTTRDVLPQQGSRGRGTNVG
jgi:hypothetical protein